MATKKNIKAKALCYESFKERFGAEGAEKIYRGVPAAQWCAARISKADDKSATALVICDKVKGMSNEIYTAIITAKSNSKKQHYPRPGNQEASRQDDEVKFNSGAWGDRSGST